MTPPIDSNQITISIPARTEFLQLLRLNVAGLAASDFSVDEIEDLKIAIEELAALLLTPIDGEPSIELALTLHNGSLTVAGSRGVGSGTGPKPDELLRTILHAVVDRFTFETKDGVTRFEFEKQSRGR